jgi:adenylate cyclase
MPQDKFKRKLTTILSADVAGYSRLMGEDEAATVKTLEQYKEIMGGLIRQHRGRVVDSPGDNLLAEFTSVVDAVQCAVATQKELKARNEELPENRRMRFRIGVNLGDVIEEESRIYGDGVNIAARLESLAEPGGICVSKTAFDQIETKLPFGYEYLGEQKVKNIVKPVGAYRVLMEPRVTVAGEQKKAKSANMRHNTIIAAAAAVLLIAVGVGIWQFSMRSAIVGPLSDEKLASPQSSAELVGDQSIAVLPLTNLTGDRKKEILCDGISEDIINALSRLPKLTVIARNSTFVYKGKAFNAHDLGEELGARYILEGSVLRADERLRVSVQLFDTTSGKNIWAETYDWQLQDLFAVQEEITLNIISALQIKLSEGLQAKLWRNRANNLEAYTKLMQALEHFRKFNKEDNCLARQLCEEAVAIDPEYAGAYRTLAWTYWADALHGFSKSSSESIKKAMDLAQKALSIDDQDPFVFYLLAGIQLLRREHDLALANIRKASEMDPNSADILAYKGLCLNDAGEPAEALASIQKAQRLNPHYSSWYDGQMGLSYHLMGDDEKALEYYKKMRERTPNSYFPRVRIILSYIDLNQLSNAQAEAVELLKISPDFSTAIWANQPYKDHKLLENELAALKKVGLP